MGCEWRSGDPPQRSIPSLRSSTIAVLRQRIVSGENGSVRGTPFLLAEGLAVAEDAVVDVVVAGCRVDGQADRLEPADELADVFSRRDELRAGDMWEFELSICSSSRAPASGGGRVASATQAGAGRDAGIDVARRTSEAR